MAERTSASSDNRVMSRFFSVLAFSGGIVFMSLIIGFIYYFFTLNIMIVLVITAGLLCLGFAHNEINLIRGVWRGNVWEK